MGKQSRRKAERRKLRLTMWNNMSIHEQIVYTEGRGKPKPKLIHPRVSYNPWVAVGGHPSTNEVFK